MQKTVAFGCGILHEFEFQRLAGVARHGQEAQARALAVGRGFVAQGFYRRT
jgi:hypothetical protein